MSFQIPSFYSLLDHQIEKYTELLAEARKTEDIKRRAHLRRELYNLKLKKQSLLN